MEQQEAVKALEFLKRVVNQAQDDTAIQNWGIIWIIHSFTNGGGFIATNVFLLKGYESRITFVSLWASILTFNFTLIFLLKKRRTGVKSFVEKQIWSIWMIFIGGILLVAAVNQLMALKIFFLGPMMGALSAISMSTMATIAGRRYYFGGAAFAIATLLMAIFPVYQFFILGVAWLVVQLPLGLSLHLERNKQKAGLV